MNIEKYRRAMVTGGAGFIGSHLVDGLLNSGLEVVCVDDFSSGYRSNVTRHAEHPAFKVIRCDVADENQLRTCFDGVDIVFHNAACKKTMSMKKPTLDVDTNVKGTLNVVRMASEHAVRKVVVASTGSVYGEATEFPQTEEHPLVPVSLYGINKLAGESIARMYCRQHDLDVTVLRYFHVYGPRQESGPFGGVIAIFCAHLLRGEAPTIFGDGSQQRSFTYVDDVVRANLLAAVDPRASGEVYNCASGIKVTVGEMYRMLAEHAGHADLEPGYGPWAEGDIKIFDVGNDRIAALGMTDWTPFRRGLAATYDWFKAELDA